MSDKKCDYQYTVRRGDSFYLIAHRLGVPLRDLLEANSSINPARLTVGDVLCIPTVCQEDAAQAPAAEPAPVASESAHASHSAAEPQPPATQEAPDPASEEPADLLDHPATGEDAAGSSQPAAPAQDPDDGVHTPAAQDGAACADGTAHVVAANETLADIQLAANVNLHTLQTANPDADLDALTEGQVLCVPRENIPCPVVPSVTLRQGDTLESTALRLNVSVGALLRANPCLAPGDFVAGACVWVPET